MAGNIPPLVSSTPPPLNAFDDDDEEEEEEDEFGLYNAAEDIDYNRVYIPQANLSPQYPCYSYGDKFKFDIPLICEYISMQLECISCTEKDEEKQNVSKCRGEQDSTSQDSATDSGLCPDSEGMSPTPHSDEERTLKQNSCDRLSQSTGEHPQGCGSELSDCQKTVPCPNLPNGHAKEDPCGQESDDDFGNFEFAPSHRVQTAVEKSFGEDVLRSQSPPSMQYTEKEHNADNGSNIHPHIEQNSEKRSSDFCLLESNLNGLVVEDSNYIPAVEESCKYEQCNMQSNEFTIEKLDIASSNDSSSFNSVDSSLETKDVPSSQCQNIEQNDVDSMEKTAKEDHENGFKSTMENFDYRENKENETPVENGDDDEFDDFTDFKAEFPGCDDLSRSVLDEQLNEHSKLYVEQTKLGEATLSLPPLNQEESDDEFSNFADFSSSDCAFVSAQSSNSLENVSHIPLKLDDSDLRTESEFQDWVSVFPCEDGESPLAGSALLRQDDVVWSRLFPLESSPALSYQWNESLSNRRLLTSLNIDSRNILFTPWSISAVPRFAANLSCGPLEPIKATEPPPAPAAPPSITTTTVSIATTVSTASTATTQESVPDAHFDWVCSGLTNPLDSCHSSLLDLNFIMTIEPQLAISPKTVLNLPKTLSAEAENILSLLPDITYMRKTYIDFPIGEA